MFAGSKRSLNSEFNQITARSNIQKDSTEYISCTQQKSITNFPPSIKSPPMKKGRLSIENFGEGMLSF